MGRGREMVHGWVACIGLPEPVFGVTQDLCPPGPEQHPNAG